MTTTHVSSGQTLSGATIEHNDAIVVDRTGEVVSTTIEPDGRLEIHGGAIASGTTVLGGGREILILSPYVAESISSLIDGGVQSDGGYSLDADVIGGGLQTLFGGNLTYGGGRADSATIGSGGGQYIGTFGSAYATVIGSGGFQVVVGSANDTVVSAGGVQVVSAYSHASNTTFLAGATEILLPGAVTYSAQVHSGASIVDTGVVVLANGALVAGTHESGISIGTGGSAYVLDGGTATGFELRGAMEVDAGGVASATHVQSGGMMTLLRGGTAVSTIVASRGVLVVSAGGEALSSIVNGGSETVSGLADGGLVTGSGQILLALDSVASGITIESGGLLQVGQGAYLQEATVRNGGSLYEFYNAAVGTLSVFGGSASLGAVALRTATVDGGVLVLQGTSATQDIVLGGSGRLELQFGASAAAAIGSGGTLVLEANGDGDGSTIAAGGAVDFATLAFVSGGGAHVTSDGVLTVHEGGQTARLQLDGSYGGSMFSIAPDGMSGSLVTRLVPVSSSALPHPAGASLADARGIIHGGLGLVLLHTC